MEVSEFVRIFASEITIKHHAAFIGMGFGLYTTSRLVDSIGKEFILHSGSHKLIIKDGQTSVIENGFWQGTLIYMGIGTGEEIDPNQIVDHRADAAEE